MTALVFKLRNVPDDEAQEVRDLLDENNIDYYETTAGNWGIAMPGLWAEGDEIARARRLIDDYQSQRSEEQRERYVQAVNEGSQPTLISRFKQRPLPILGIVLFCLFVLYAMVSPFIRMATQGLE